MKSYHLVTLGSGHGTYATLDAADNSIVFRQLESWAGQQWAMLEQDDGLFVFKPLSTAPALSVGADGVVRAVEGPNVRCTVQPAPESRVTIGTDHGLLLGIDAAGRLVARAAADGAATAFELVQFKEFEAALQGMQDCCGSDEPHTSSAQPRAAAPTDLGRVMWNDPGHQNIVQWAKAIVLAHQAHIPSMGRACELLQHSDFWRGVQIGLREADNALKPEYAGWLYSSHFYDPTTGRNFLGQTFDNALTEADRRFLESTALVLDGNPTRLYDAGFALGLALHYITDLTQPMHAANFINFRTGPFDHRHSEFEGHLDTEMGKHEHLYRVDPASVDPAREFAPAALLSSTAELVKAVAQYSHDVFTSQLKPILDSIPITWLGSDRSGKWPSYPDQSWLKRTDAFLATIIRHAQLSAARFLVRWGQAVSAVSLLPFVAAGLSAGDSGAWTFSATGADGTWRRGDYNGHAAKVQHFSATRLHIAGTFSSFWWGFGEVIPLSVDVEFVQASGQWQLTVTYGQHTATYQLHPPRVYAGKLCFEYVLPPDKVSEAALVMEPLYKNLSWYAGVQLTLSAPNCIHYVCFEDKSI